MNTKTFTIGSDKEGTQYVTFPELDSNLDYMKSFVFHWTRYLEQTEIVALWLFVRFISKNVLGM